VITPAEFERNMSMCKEAAGEKNGTRQTDSWCGNNQSSANNGSSGNMQQTMEIDRPDQAMPNTAHA